MSSHLKKSLKASLATRHRIVSCLMFLLLLGACKSTLQAQQALKEKDRTAILGVMQLQEDAWNSGNLEGFMEGYWKSDSLMFIGKSGLTRGWAQTLANYQKGYPDKAAMGKLTFGIIAVKTAGKGAAFVVGSWHLSREAGDLSGHFSLLWKKMGKEWVIVADHSS